MRARKEFQREEGIFILKIKPILVFNVKW
jgi:hypothetical protein